jgi:phosphoribosyl-ATP pyrophosphohydrolase
MSKENLNKLAQEQELKKLFEESNAPEAIETWQKAVSKSLIFRQLSHPIADVFYSVNSCINSLNVELEDLNKNKRPREQRDCYPQAIEAILKKKMNDMQELDNSNFINDYKSETLNRVKQKLSLLKNPDLILGFEYILDEMIAKKIEDFYFEKIAEEEKVELSDVFDNEALSNIDNYLSN